MDTEYAISQVYEYNLKLDLPWDGTPNMLLFDIGDH